MNKMQYSIILYFSHSFLFCLFHFFFCFFTHRIILDQLLVQFNVTHLDESAKKELNLIWHKLSPWTDTLEGLEKLKSKYTIVTLSNGNLSLLSDMAKNAGERRRE